MQDLDEEAFKVSTTVWIQSVLQGNIVFLQVHVLHCLQVDLCGNNITVTTKSLFVGYFTNIYMVLNYFKSTLKWIWNLSGKFRHLAFRLQTQTYLRAAYNDANECAFISAGSLHGSIKASGKIQLRVLSTPHYKNTNAASVTTRTDIWFDISWLVSVTI